MAVSESLLWAEDVQRTRGGYSTDKDPPEDCPEESHTHTRTHTDTQACAHTTHTCARGVSTHSYACAHIQRYTCAHVNMLVHACAHADTHARMYAHGGIHARMTRTDRHTHIHMPISCIDFFYRNTCFIEENYSRLTIDLH